MDPAALRGEVAGQLRRPFSRTRVNELVASLLKGRSNATLADAPLEGQHRKGPYGFPRGRLERRRKE